MVAKVKKTSLIGKLILCSITILCLLFLFTPVLWAQSSGKKLSREEQKGVLENLTKPEVIQAAKALGLALQGISDPASISPVSFDSGASVPEPDPFIVKNNFRLTQVLTTHHEMSPDDENTRAAGGVLMHSDVFGRYMMTGFSVNFKMASGRVLIENAKTFRYDSTFPRVFFYYVPADRISPNVLKTYSYTRLLTHASKNAIPVGTKARIDPTVKEYYLFAFFMDRTAEDAKVSIAVNFPEKAGGTPAKKAGVPTGSSTGTGKFSFKKKRHMIGTEDSSQKHSGSISRQEKGWHVAFTKLKFGMDSEGMLLFKVLFTPGSNVKSDKRKQLLADIYTSSVSEVYIGLVRGIQFELKKQGYDTGPVNGEMNEKTRQAILSFQKANKFKVDGQPTADLLRLLSGRTLVPQAEVPKSAPAAVDRKPASTKKTASDIKRMQKRLAELGYYKGPINGENNQEFNTAVSHFQRDRKHIEENLKERAAAQKKQPASKPVKKQPKKPAPKVAAKKPVAQKRNLQETLGKFKSKMWPNRISLPFGSKQSEGFSLIPEPIMFVVPAASMGTGKLPGNFADLLEHVGMRAVPVKPGALKKQKYVIFIFLKDSVSPTSTLEVKVSDNLKGTGGYKESSKYLYLTKHRIGYLSGQMTLFNSSPDSLLYIKAVFKPGKEVSFFSRSAKQVGLFSTSGR